MAYAPGTVFAGFTIERTIGTGGMGTVYLARHPRLPRRDALKLLRADLSADIGFRDRFEREADLAARLDHRNVVTVYDRGKTDDQLWIDMQYVDGIDAAQALTDGGEPMPVERVLRIVSEVGAGLDYAHRHGLWHRDVKPANILLAAASDDEELERVLLTDFGVAKAVDEARQLTSTGNMLATLAYAAPEQIESRALDHRVDIYALSCVLYELLTGSVPFPEPTAYATMAAHLNKAPPRATAVRPELPDEVDDVIARGMAKSREDRFASCRELAQAARRALAPAVAPATPPTAAEPPPATEPPPVPEPPPYVEPSATAVTPVEARPPVPPVTAPPRPSGPVSQRPSGPVGPRPPYQIRVRRRGPRGEEDLGPVYTDTLSLLETGALEELLGRAEFFMLPPLLPSEPPQTGDVRQEITVISAGRTHTVGYDLGGSRRPPALDEFVARLEHLAPWRGDQRGPFTGPFGAAAGGVPPSGPLPAPPAGPQPLLAPLHPPPGPTHRRPWYTKPAALAGLAAALVLVVVLGIVVAVSGSDSLPAPESVAAEATASAVELSWEEVPGATEYEVRRDGDLLDTTDETTFVDDEVQSGERYRYTVVALGSGDVESPAAARSVTVPEPRAAPPTPAGLSVSRVDGNLEISWDEVADATTYNLFRGAVRVYAGPQTSFVDENAPLGSSEYSVLAATSDGTVSERSRGVPITLSDNWGELAEIVAAFPNLLPSNPSINGYEDSVCGVGGAELDTLAAGVAVCDYPSGIHVELRRYADQGALDQRLTQVTTEAEPPEEWFYSNDGGDPTLGGTFYESRPDDEVAFRFATFVREDRVLMALYVEWPGHSGSELFSEWWLPAPF